MNLIRSGFILVEFTEVSADNYSDIYGYKCGWDLQQAYPIVLMVCKPNQQGNGGTDEPQVQRYLYRGVH